MFYVWQSAGEGSLDDRLRNAFTRIDKDNSGNITLAEFREFIQSVGGSLSDADIEAAIKEIDKDGNGEISFQGI